MSASLGEPSGRAAPKPTEHQLALARVRARTTGESLSHVLSVFMGAGRYGEDPGSRSTGPEAPLGRDDGVRRAPGTDGEGGGGSDGGKDGGNDGGNDIENRAQLAPVIPLSRARGSHGDGARGAGDGPAD